MIYDAVSNLLSVTTGIAVGSYAHPATTSYVYDVLNRRTQEIDAFGVSGLTRTTTIAYDKVGNVIQVTDALGHITSTSYDALNRATRIDEAYGTSVAASSTMIYDATDNLLSVTQGISPTATYAPRSGLPWKPSPPARCKGCGILP
jgi:YD repeat-containing protein